MAHTKTFIAVVVALIVLTVAFGVLTEEKTRTAAATIGDRAFTLEIADTAALRAKGLSDRADLPTGTGMLFVFPAPDRHAFWMKDMQFPVDILWFDADRRLVTALSNVSPDTYPQVFEPTAESLYVVELPAGTADAQGFRPGTELGAEELLLFPEPRG